MVRKNGGGMRQNRVDPLGRLLAVAPRGAWFGNKGCLHDATGQIRRSHHGRRWITCVTAFKGRRRPLMQPGRYTEVFFLDEATAYAAGHRPCAECRRAAYDLFSGLWSRHHGDTGAEAIDRALHAARLDGKARRLVTLPAAQVPPGAMILRDGQARVRTPDGWFDWYPEGYRRGLVPAGSVALLTPLPVALLMARGLSVQIASPCATPE